MQVRSAGREELPRAHVGWGQSRPVLSGRAALSAPPVSAASESAFQGFCEFPAWLSLGCW